MILHEYRSAPAKSTLAEPARLAAKANPDVAAIRAYLADGSLATRLVAVFALWHVGTPDAAAGLVAAAGDRHQIVRRNAVRALGKVGKGIDAAVAAVRAAQKDCAKDVRAAAVKAAKQMRAK